jgi:hypothetical protein
MLNLDGVHALGEIRDKGGGGTAWTGAGVRRFGEVEER